MLRSNSQSKQHALRDAVLFAGAAEANGQTALAHYWRGEARRLGDELLAPALKLAPQAAERRSGDERRKGQT